MRTQIVRLSFSPSYASAKIGVLKFNKTLSGVLVPQKVRKKKHFPKKKSFFKAVFLVFCKQDQLLMGASQGVTQKCITEEQVPHIKTFYNINFQLNYFLFAKKWQRRFGAMPFVDIALEAEKWLSTFSEC